MPVVGGLRCGTVINQRATINRKRITRVSEAVSMRCGSGSIPSWVGGSGLVWNGKVVENGGAGPYGVIYCEARKTRTVWLRVTELSPLVQVPADQAVVAEVGWKVTVTSA